MNVLIVDDVGFMRRIVARPLDDLGFQTHSADGPDEALRILDANPDIDLVITDLEMPGKNGVELQASCKQKLGDKCPHFVLLTASNNIEELRQAKRQGFFDIQMKPLNIERLLERLDPLIPEDLRAKYESTLEKPAYEGEIEEPAPRVTAKNND